MNAIISLFKDFSSYASYDYTVYSMNLLMKKEIIFFYNEN